MLPLNFIRRAVRRGLIPDLADLRDRLYDGIRSGRGLPESADWTRTDPAPHNQLTLGSCVGHGGAFAQECLDAADGPFADLSERDLYWQCRKIMGTVEIDSGARIRDAVKVMARRGVCREELCPYDVDGFADAPGPAADADASGHRIADYYRIGPLRRIDDIRDAVARGLPVIFGISCYESMFTGEVARTGRIPLPKRGERLDGGHCLVARGYDDRTATVKGPNWWGRSWGDFGNFHLPYDYIESLGLASDIWVVRKLAQ